jgi:hypothetical protein
MGAERRHAKRHRIEHLAILLTNNGRQSRYCIVTELSDGGIRIKTIGDAVPNEFTLCLTENATPRRYRVVWRGDGDVGAKLIDPAVSAEANRTQNHAA